MEFLIREEDCKAAIQGYLGSSDFVLEDYKVKPAGSGHAGFMGRHYALTAAVHFGDRLQEIHLFAKLPPITVAHRAFVMDLKLIHRECTAYGYLAPMLRSCLPPTVTLPIPKCHFLRDTVQSDLFPAPGTAEEEIIILEDANHLGFRALNKCPLLDLPHCRVVMKTLARFHAASILCEHSDDAASGAKGDGGMPFLDDLWERKVSDSVVTACTESIATAATEIWPERFAGEDVSETLREAWETVRSVCREFPEHAKVLCHGDAWANNLMFAYEGGEDSEVPVDCMLVDLRGVQYAPPATDVLLFLHTCTTREFRRENADSLLDYYHYKLGECVGGGDLLEAILPLPSFLQSCSDLKVVGLVLSTAYLPVVLEEVLEGPLARERHWSDPLDINEAVLNAMGERIASNCRLNKDYGDRVLACFRECLECLGLWN